MATRRIQFCFVTPEGEEIGTRSPAMSVPADLTNDQALKNMVLAVVIEQPELAHAMLATGVGIQVLDASDAPVPATN